MFVVTPKKYLVETDQEGGGESHEYYDYDPDDMKTLLRLNDIAESTGHLSEKQKEQVIHLLNKNPHIYNKMLEENAKNAGSGRPGMQNKGIFTGALLAVVGSIIVKGGVGFGVEAAAEAIKDKLKG